MKRYLLITTLLLGGCVGDNDVYQVPELRETYIRSEKGYKVMIVAGSDTLVTSQPVKIKYVKE